jgi:protein ImuA
MPVPVSGPARMASLPLFSPSFMPRDGAVFTPARPATLEPPTRPVARVAASPSTSAVSSSPAPAGSPVERTEAALRQAGLAGRFWRGDALSTSPLPSVPSGFRALDEELPGGGWPSRCLTELLLSHVGTGEIRFLATTLSSLTQAGREIVLLGPPHLPDPTGWEQLSIDMRRVLIVRTPRPADRLWAIEQSLKSSAFGALVAWLPEEKTLTRNDALRRLQLAAASANGLTFLMRPAAAQFHASPAPLRLTLAAGKPDGVRRTLSVRLIKRRGPVLARPLTLMLPEIHRGMKAFSVAAAEKDPETKALVETEASIVASHGERGRRLPREVRHIPSATPVEPTMLDPHALAGTLLSDARA